MAPSDEAVTLVVDAQGGFAAGAVRGHDPLVAVAAQVACYEDSRVLEVWSAVAGLVCGNIASESVGLAAKVQVSGASGYRASAASSVRDRCVDASVAGGPTGIGAAISRALALAGAFPSTT
jgi:hypothetical protein